MLHPPNREMRSPAIGPDGRAKLSQSSFGSGEDAHKRRHQDRPNLKKSNLKELTLGILEVEKRSGAARPVQLLPPSPVGAPTLQRTSSANLPRTFANRGHYEQLLAEMLAKFGADGWEVLGSLEDHKVNALCRRLKNKTLTQAEINEVAARYRKTSLRCAAGVAV